MSYLLGTGVDVQFLQLELNHADDIRRMSAIEEDIATLETSIE